MESKDERLWRMAKKRASFKKSLYSYMVIVAFMWAIWWITTGRYKGFESHPWPVWIMLGWGVALGFQYFEAYNGDKDDLAHEEYERLKKQQDL